MKQIIRLVQMDQIIQTHKIKYMECSIGLVEQNVNIHQQIFWATVFAR